ncbi:MAG: hypothetical protein LUI02_03670 [Clostridiales bacterium]|nr:hypothetical protein [Clostridiales bacterium]
MKKKCFAVLAALLVLAMGATTVFAATSPTASDAVVEKLNSAVSSVTVSGSDANVTTSSVSSEAYALALEEVKAEGDTIVAMADISYSGTVNGSVTVEISVPGIEATDNVYVMHYRTLTGTWEYLTPSYVGNGKVAVSMTAFSPIFVVVGSTGSTDGDDETVVNPTDTETDITDNGNTTTDITDNGNTSTNITDDGNTTATITDDGNTTRTVKNSYNTTTTNTSYTYINGVPADDSAKATTLAATTVTAGTSTSDAAPQTGEGLPILPIAVVAVVAAMGVVALCGTKARKSY